MSATIERLKEVRARLHRLAEPDAYGSALHIESLQIAALVATLIEETEEEMNHG